MSDYLNPPPLSPSKITFSSNPDDVLGVVEILSLVTDPAEHKKRLDELQKAVQEADRKIAEAKAVSERRRTAESMFAEAAKIMVEHKTAGAKLDARDGDLTRREKDLIDREDKFNRSVKDREAEAEARHRALADREKAAVALEESCVQQLRKIAEDRAKIEKLKAEVREFHAKFQAAEHR